MYKIFKSFFAIYFICTLAWATESFKEIQSRAEAGDVEAQQNLALAYVLEGETQDFEKAFIWVQKAAEQGYAAAQFNLGHMYYRGDGVAQDSEKALIWSQKAAEQGHAGAQKILRELKNFSKS